jgi:hypothetical protein
MDFSVIASLQAVDSEVIGGAIENFRSGLDALQAVGGGEDLDVLGIHDGLDSLPDFG